LAEEEPQCQRARLPEGNAAGPRSHRRRLPPAAPPGIGRPTGNLDVASYVLQDFRQSEMAEVDNAIAGEPSGVQVHARPGARGCWTRPPCPARPLLVLVPHAPLPLPAAPAPPDSLAIIRSVLTLGLDKALSGQRV
jgi:hypothetical protein